MKATGIIPSHSNIHRQNLAKSVLFPVYQKLDKLICTAILPEHLKRDLGWGNIPCQALICLPTSTAIISHIISVTIASKSSSPRWEPHCYPVHKHTAKTSALVAMEPGYWAWSKQIEKYSFSLLLMVAPCWQTQNLGKLRSGPLAAFTKKRKKSRL